MDAVFKSTSRNACGKGAPDLKRREERRIKGAASDGELHAKKLLSNPVKRPGRRLNPGHLHLLPFLKAHPSLSKKNSG
ncbi:hypothetical protein GBM96_09290 [Sutterella seckii]|uniref:Uncharacterized protein n=1 Tax=Sutterella seckii TaxID=1944635 RepID=A0AAI9SAE3_9BURK|nr:hypothetical protein GBM96_09290 [Sutterella seckii]